MNVRQLKELFEIYKSFLRSENKDNRLHLWESQSLFQKHWNPEEVDFSKMYDHSLQNSTTKRLWKRENYEPKRIMLEFIKMDPEWARQMFGELFDESKSLEGRLGRFIFYCDLFLENFKKAHPTSIENNHYHEDGYEITFLYLAFRYPDNYAPHDHEAFVNFLKKVKAVEPPIVPDVERYAKVCRTVFKMMSQDEELMELHRERLVPGESYMEDSLILVYDFFMAMEEG